MPKDSSKPNKKRKSLRKRSTAIKENAVRKDSDLRSSDIRKHFIITKQNKDKGESTRVAGSVKRQQTLEATNTR